MRAHLCHVNISSGIIVFISPSFFYYADVCQLLQPVLCCFSFLKNIYLFIYFAVLGLSCSMWDLFSCGMWAPLVAACRLLVVACGI